MITRAVRDFASPSAGRGGVRGHSRWWAVWALLLTCALTGPASAAGPGAKMYQEFLEQGALYDDEGWQQYVDAVGQRLLAVSPDAGKPYHFFVIDDTSVNAFALPDGYIFVNRGLLAYLRSEDELAFVLGHEIGHVVGRHAAEKIGRARIGNIAGIVGSLLTGSGAIADLSNSYTRTIVSGYGRSAELEADEFGAEWLARAGYNPLAVIDAIHVLKDHSLFAKNVLKQPTVYHGLFSTHPKNDKRLHEAVQKSQHLFPDELMDTEGDFWGLMDGLTYGKESSTGLIKGTSYYHGVLRVVVSFPTDWDVVNTTREILGTPIAGSTDMSIAVQRLGGPGAGVTPEGYLSDTLKRDDLKNGVDITVNGFAGHMADIEVADGSGRTEKIAIIFKDSSAYLFKGVLSPQGDLVTFERSWQDTVQSFRAMTAEDLKIANDQRIAVIVAKPSDTFASLARKSSIKSYPEETLRVINGQHPVGEPRAGDYIKIVQ